MNLRGAIVAILGLAVVLSLRGEESAPPAAASPPAPALAPAAVLVILGDQHSAYDRTARLVAFVDELKAAHPHLPMAVLLNGDTQEHGNVIARRSGGAIDFAHYAALARRAPTIINLGNHEPEFHDLAETVRRIEEAGARVVTNIRRRDTGAPFAPASVTLALGSAAATVVGIATDFLATYRVAVRPSLDLAAPAVWAKANLPQLLESGPGALNIVLSHAGLAADRGLLALVPDGTLFAGAHDHQRFVATLDRTVYFHSGSWNSHASLAWLRRDSDGRVHWTVEQVELKATDPADPAMAALVAKVRADHLTPEDRAVVGRSPAPLATPAAGRFVAEAVRRTAKVDAAFVGNTTFGAGLPRGDVSRLEFDACVRFDGAIFEAEVDGVRLAKLLAEANLSPETPLAARKGEFSFAVGPASVDPAGRYRIATTDWGARNTARYFGEPALAWREIAGVRLKAAALAALNAP